MSGAIAIVYPTGRDDPAFGWFADSLARQLADDDDVEVVVVDRLHDARREEATRAAARGRFAIAHVPAKPSPWQGAHRLTSTDRFAAASARNTGLVHARAPYVVFADDCSVVMPGWWRAVKRAARDGVVVAGAYEKRRGLVVRDGRLVAGRSAAGGRDSRWAQGSDARPVPIGGGQLYGASFGAPRDLLLSVNGLDEMCDGLGQEDVQLGLRLAAAGAPILYDRSMLTVESEELHAGGDVLERHDRWLSEERYRERLAGFGVRVRCTSGRTDASHMMIDIVLGTGSWATHGNYYWLADLVPERYPEMVARFPTHHWFDGCPLSTM